MTTTKQETTTTTIPPPVVTKCANCNVEERFLLHVVRSRTGFRRLCTSCVLKLHPQSFCPTCFVVYDRYPPQNVTTCFKCYSYSHNLCIGPHAPKPYLCPPCANPNAPSFFTPRIEELEGGAGKCRAVDKKAAGALLAAATIAAASINKVAASLKADAASKAKEAVIARKKAREALEHVAYLVAREKDNPKCRENVVDAGTSVNAVDLKGKERLQGFRHNNGVPNSVPNNHAIVQKSEGSSVTQLNSNTPRGENVKIGPLSIFNAAVDQPEHMDDNVDSQKDMDI